MDVGIARAGAAFTARRRELGLKQRELARLKLISASSLVAFEKGRSWPRERTLAKLEELVQWPAGTIAAIRSGGEIPGAEPAPAPAPEQETSPLVELVDVAVTTIDVAVRALPETEAPRFGDDCAPILTDLRRLEGIALRALRHSGGSAPVVVALARIRRRYHQLMLRAAETPGATVGQRLYAARHAACLTATEAAAALGVPAEMVVAIEAGSAPSVDVMTHAEDLIADLAAAR